MSYDKNSQVSIPAWVPEDIRHYVLHTEFGQPIRALARRANCHASTVMRQVRKVEVRREDALTGAALYYLAGSEPQAVQASNLEQLQALRRLADPGALLAIAQDMEMGVIIREGPGRESDRAASIEVRIARVLALRGWIEGSGEGGRVTRYRITAAGRSGLRDLVARSENRAREMAEAPVPFRHKTDDGWDKPQVKAIRLAASESPVQGLARRKDKDGKPFLNRDMVRAAERLREEFEIAHVGANVTQDWSRFLSAGAEVRQGTGSGSRMDARGGVEAAFKALGPGLAEVVYRTCCLMEGLEATEQRMGWSARSGKIVLRIALQRLVLHYEATGQIGPKIG